MSFVVLFIEVSLIRWLPGHVRALAYFKNVVLISSFLGIGLGSLLGTRVRSLAMAFPLLFILEIETALILGRCVILGAENAGEHLWLLYGDLPMDAPVFPLWAAIVIFYGLNTLTFVPLGQWLGRELVNVRNPIAAYCASLLGSIAGTIAVVGVSLAGWGPLLWFTPRDAAVTWSPYYALSRSPIQSGGIRVFKPGELVAADGSDIEGHNVMVNGSFHQAPIDLSRRPPGHCPAQEQLRNDYAIPYSYARENLGVTPRDVLIVGAGTGNDVQIALDHGAEYVDAVEIDPVILEWGKKIHPNHPYADPRVHTHVDDARAFLQNTQRRYDLVVFGTLDSQTSLSALSNIRLDNYVYTVESMAQARSVLKPGGVLALYFWVGKDWILGRLAGNVEAAFGRAPKILIPDNPRLFNLILIATATADSHSAAAYPRVTTSTDDWPYLYQEHRRLSPFYMNVIAILAAFSALAVFIAVLPAFGGGGYPVFFQNFHLPLFLQGAAFMLLETTAISTLSLVFGSTWTVNAFVIGIILFLILAANLTVARFGINRIGTILAGLAVSLIAAYFESPRDLLHSNYAIRLAANGFVALSPIFFSSMLFAVLFRDARDVAWAYGSNLVGSVFGGLLEFGSVLTGLRALNLVALLLYLLAAMAYAVKCRRCASDTSRS